VQPVLFGARQRLGEARLRAPELGDARLVRALVERGIGERGADLADLARELRQACLDGGELLFERAQALPETGARGGRRASPSRARPSFSFSCR
jgi:hypothetical protein